MIEVWGGNSRHRRTILLHAAILDRLAGLAGLTGHARVRAPGPKQSLVDNDAQALLFATATLAGVSQKCLLPI